MNTVIVVGFVVAIVMLAFSAYRRIKGRQSSPAPDLTLEEYRRVQEAASSRHRSDR